MLRLLNNVRIAIESANLDKAMDLFKSIENPESRQLVSTLIPQYAAFKTEMLRGTMSFEQQTTRRNQIVSQALLLCNELENLYNNSVNVVDGSRIPKVNTNKKGKFLQKVYFSYAWGDEEEEGESREEIVDTFFRELASEPYELLRDKMNLKYGGLISEFIEELGEGDLIIVFISDKYVKSEYCMFELYEIARNAKLDKNNFAKKILPVRVESIAFDDPDVLGKYFQFWSGKMNKWEDLIKSRMGQMGGANMSRYQKIKSINQNFGDLVDWLQDINASSKKLLSEDDFALLKKTIRNRLNQR